MIDLLKGVREYVYPVGRLDFDSEGLLILTNDGDLAARLTHPSHEVPRVYEARVLGEPDAHDLDRLVERRDGRGPRTARPSDAARARSPADHRARRQQPAGPEMCEAIGHPVNELRRVSIGPIRDPKLSSDTGASRRRRKSRALRRATK